jgi:hypothetical protein
MTVDNFCFQWPDVYLARPSQRKKGKSGRIIHTNVRGCFFNPHLARTNMFSVEKALLYDEKISSFLQ